MNVVAIYDLPEVKESLGDKLASALDVTVFEALSRLRTPGNGPIVVAVFSDTGPAHQLVEKLSASGFHAIHLADDEIVAEVRHPSVKRFSLGEGAMHVETPQGADLDIPYLDVQLVIRGTRIAVSTSTETVKNRSFSLGRAVLSGGMVLSKTTKTVRETTHQERENFFTLYTKAGACTFNEKGVVYDSLGPALQPASAANFGYLVGELRRRCAGAVYDERLMKRVSQAALLGPRLSPETHLGVATALLAKVLRRGR